MSNEEFNGISFDLPKNQSNVIKVIGVGGGGSNAINYMFQAGIKGVDFVVCNTDAQALQNSPVPKKIQLGVSLTEGLGAGANPAIGEQSALESFDELKTMLESNTKMVFITAGMGGGTGTGAAPIIARLARDLEILTVGIVTIPFLFEGKMRNKQAQQGVENLRTQVDSLIVINNNKLREVYGNLGFKAGFAKADEVLATAARGIAEVITHHYTQNIDLRDAKTVLANSGTAIMGSAAASGAERAQKAIGNALDSPLLNDNKITGAKNVLLLIVSGVKEITIDEIGEINDFIQSEAGHGANIIMGVGEDEGLDEAIAVTIIATGFNAEQQHEIVNTETKKIIHTLEDEQVAEQVFPLQDEIATSVASVIRVPDQNKPSLNKEEERDGELLPTTQLMRNMLVSYEEVSPVDDDFVIIETTPKIRDIEVKQSIEVLPLENANEFLLFDLDKEEYKTEDSDCVLEEPQNLAFEQSLNNWEKAEAEPGESEYPDPEAPEKRYSLEDYMELETRLSNAALEAGGEIEPDEELMFEKKLVNTEEENALENSTDDHPIEKTPLNSSINESLRQRSAERKKTLRDYNYKFRHHANEIGEIEKQPAYKRRGIELDGELNDVKGSSLSVSEDSNEETQLRSNNSFLHDNVD